MVSPSPASIPKSKTGQRQDGALVRVRGYINGTPIVCLIDTGASRCFLSRGCWERVGNKQLKNSDVLVSQADKRPLRTLGTGVVSIKIGKETVKVEVTVCENLIDDCVLGCNFIREQKCVVNPSENCVVIKGQRVDEYVIEPAAVVLCESLVIPARTEVIGRVKVAADSVHVPRVIEPSTRCWEKYGCMVSHSLITDTEGSVLLRNPTQENITVHKDMYLGSAVACTLVEEHNLESNNTPPHSEFDWQEAARHLTQGQLKRAKEAIDVHAQVVSREKNDTGRTGVLKHKINTGTAQPIRMTPRRLPLARRTEAQQEVQRMLEAGVIRPSSSPWCFPAVLIRKKDGTMRFCVDFRKLNEVTVKDSYPLPRIDDVLDSLSGSTLFSALDLQSGYWQCEVKEKDRSKTAFSIGSGLYEFNVLPFGVCNGPATFQRLMDLILEGLNWEAALVYLDDVIVFGRTFEEHLERLLMVLNRLQSAGLKVNPRKCRLFHQKVEFLGHIVSQDGIATDHGKLQAVDRWPVPKNLTELRSFLGLASYYRRFVLGFASIADPLHRLLNKGERFTWNEDCDNAFKKLKRCLVTAPVLAYPNPKLPFLIDVDASGTGIGGVLSQVQNGQERVVAYYSRSLTKAERRYCVTRRELLALVAVCRQFKGYLLGARFTARTDHNCLIWLQGFREPEGQVARWLEILAEYEIQVEHRPGKKHGNADGLSRRPCSQCGIGEEKEQLPSVCVLEDSVNTPTLVTEQIKDECCGPVIRVLNKEIPESVLGKIPHKLYSLKPELKDQVLCIVDRTGQLPEYRTVVPQSMIPEILRAYHSNAAAGAHMGVTRTLARLRERFFWFNMQRDVAEWCRKCEDCNRRKSPIPSAKSPLITHLVKRPLERVALDILGPLPLTERGNKYIMVVSDYFTKWTEAYALPNQTAETCAQAFVNEFVCRYGAPEILHSDQGRQFESQLFQEMCRLLEIKKTHTSPFRPQSDGMVERFNRTLLNMLSHWTGEHQRNWDAKLPQVMLAYRTSRHDSTRYTPFNMMFGHEVRLPVDAQYGLPPHSLGRSDQEFVRNLRTSLDQAHEAAREHLGAAHRRQKECYDRTSKSRSYKVGDVVWIHQPTPRVGESSKLHRPWTGPYKVVKDIGMHTFRVQHCALKHKRFVVHQDRMKPCAEIPTPDQARREERAKRRPGRPRRNAEEERQQNVDSRWLEEITGDVFNAPPDYSLAHCVAEDLKMGAGIAVDFKERFRGVEQLKNQRLKVGDVGELHSNGRHVFYLVTKKCSNQKPTYNSLRQTLCRMRDIATTGRVSKIAMPMIGCGLDGLREDRVKELIRQTFCNQGITVRIYKRPQNDGYERSAPDQLCEKVSDTSSSCPTPTSWPSPGRESFSTDNFSFLDSSDGSNTSVAEQDDRSSNEMSETADDIELPTAEDALSPINNLEEATQVNVESGPELEHEEESPEKRLSDGSIVDSNIEVVSLEPDLGRRSENRKTEEVESSGCVRVLPPRASRDAARERWRNAFRRKY